jgi:hypothetical protein
MTPAQYVTIHLCLRWPNAVSEAWLPPQGGSYAHSEPSPFQGSRIFKGEQSKQPGHSAPSARRAIALLGHAYLAHRARIDREIAFERMIAGMRTQAEEFGSPPGSRKPNPLRAGLGYDCEHRVPLFLMRVL